MSAHRCPCRPQAQFHVVGWRSHTAPACPVGLPTVCTWVLLPSGDIWRVPLCPLYLLDIGSQISTWSEACLSEGNSLGLFPSPPAAAQWPVPPFCATSVASGLLPTGWLFCSRLNSGDVLLLELESFHKEKLALASYWVTLRCSPCRKGRIMPSSSLLLRTFRIMSQFLSILWEWGQWLLFLALL